MEAKHSHRAMGKKGGLTTMKEMDLAAYINGDRGELTIEEKLIGNFIGYQGYCFVECDALISADDFMSGKCSQLYRSIKRLNDAGTHIDIATVYTDLQEHNIRDISPIELSQLSTCERSEPYKLASYVWEQSRRRQMITTLGQALQDLSRNDKELSSTLEGIRKAIDDATAKEREQYVRLDKPMGELMGEVVKRANGEINQGIMTGFTIVDEKGGFQPTDLVIIAGDTSMGKTSLAMCMIKNIAESGTPCAVYSMEMSSEQLCARLLAVDIDDNKPSGAIVPSSSDILYNQLSIEQYEHVHNAYMRIGRIPIYIDTRASHDIDDICSSIRALVYMRGVKVVVLDYIQLVSVKRQSDDVKAMDKIARDLKVLAKELGIVVIALSQLARVKEGSSPIPTIKRLRNSGGIEQAADNIYLIFRAEYYKTQYPGGWASYPTHNTALLIRAKGRNIGTAERLLEFCPAATAYRNYDADRYQRNISQQAAPAPKQPSSDDINRHWADGIGGEEPF